MDRLPRAKSRASLAGLTVAICIGGAHGTPSAQPLPLPAELAWVCAYSDAAVLCTDTIFVSPALTDCGNGLPLTAYKGGAGTMILTGPTGERLQYAYASRSYNVRGGPGNLDVVRLFPYEAQDFGFVGDFETCIAYERE